MISDGVEYKMWFDGTDLTDKPRIGLATSGNGITWTKYLTNPVLTGEQFEQLERRAEQLVGPSQKLSTYPAPEGRVKTSAAWLIERSGFARGHGEGNVGISSRHTLALVNRGGASTAELVTLAHEIADGVKREFGVELMPEPVFVGLSW